MTTRNSSKTGLIFIVIDIASPMAFSRIKEELKQTNSSWKFKKNKEGEITCLTFEADEKEIINRFQRSNQAIPSPLRFLNDQDSIQFLNGEGFVSKAIDDFFFIGFKS